MSLTSYRAAPPRVKSVLLLIVFSEEVSSRLEDLAATYSPVP